MHQEVFLRLIMFRASQLKCRSICLTNLTYCNSIFADVTQGILALNQKTVMHWPACFITSKNHFPDQSSTIRADPDVSSFVRPPSPPRWEVNLEIWRFPPNLRFTAPNLVLVLPRVKRHCDTEQKWGKERLESSAEGFKGLVIWTSFFCPLLKYNYKVLGCLIPCHGCLSGPRVDITQPGTDPFEGPCNFAIQLSGNGWNG